MNSDSHISQLAKTDYILGVNINSSNENGDSQIIQNEPSNYLSVVLPSTYKVIGFINNSLSNRTYYFLTSTETDINSVNFKRSSIGYVDNTLNEVFNEDVPLAGCIDCNNPKNDLGTPLENIIQTPSQLYIELVHDRCISLVDIEEKGLNFNINFPIKKIEIKQEKLGTTLYWNDWRNYFRYLQVGLIEEALENNTFDYLHSEDIACDDPQPTACLNVEKLLVSPKHTRLRLEANQEQIGGNLKQGTYEFWAAYCDSYGNEITEYSTPTNPISIWDENNYIQSQTTTDDFTNYAIKLKVHNLDRNRFKYYKIAVVERNNVSNTQSVFLAGIYPTIDDVVVYTHSGSSNDDLHITRGNNSVKKRMDFNTLTAIKPTYKRMKGTMVSDDRIFGFGLEEEEEINIQPVVNLFTPLVKWSTTATTEKLYKSPTATSKYKGYQRGEVQPFALRLLYNDGGYSANFPFIGRPKTDDDAVIISASNKNRKSLDEAVTACTINDRAEKWEIFNTATVSDIQICDDSYTQSGITTTEDVEKYCIVDIATVIPTDTLELTLTTPFYGLEDYINTHGVEICTISSPYYNAFLCGYLSDTYLETCTPPFAGDCSAPVLVDEVVIIDEVVGETKTFIEKDLTDYRQSVPPKYCFPFLRSTTTGGYQVDTPFMDVYSPCRNVFLRDGDFQNESCLYATEIPLQTDPSQFLGMNFLNYDASLLKTNLLVDNLLFASSTIATGFEPTIHNKAQFFKVEKNDRTDILLEFTKKSNCIGAGDLFETDILNNEIRYTIYDDCGTPVELDSGIVDLSVGELLPFDITTFPDTFIVAIDTKIVRHIIKDNCASPYPNITSTTYTQPTSPISVPTPVINETVLIEDIGKIYTYDGAVWNLSHEVNFVVAPPCGCFGLYVRDIEYGRVDVSWEEIKLAKKITYTSTCTFNIPRVNDCDPVPYKKGKMAFWESTLIYPDNKELYDSSILNIKPSDLSAITAEDKLDFEDYYTDGLDIDGNYIWKIDVARDKPVTDFRCDKIKHPKFPDNTIAPFIIDSMSYKSNADSIIFPLGISLDSNIVQTMIEVAHLNGLITKKQKNKIVGWEVLRGDNTIHKSIIANGIGSDVYNYTKNNQKIHFSNFPFNDLGENKFCNDPATGGLIQPPINRNLFTFFSPDTFLTSPSLPTEMSLQGYMCGEANMGFADVKKHPKWTVLGDKAYDLANKLASAEVALEIIVAVANGTKELTVGWTSINIGGVIAGALTAIAFAVQSFVKLGRYRYAWLEIFRNLGRADNFASFQYGAGKLNKFIPSDVEDDNYLRRLSLKKYLKDGNYNFIDENDGSSINVNNDLREHSVLLATGKQDIDYTNPDYVTYDNNKQGSRSSNFTASEESCQNNTNYLRNISNPYMSLRNYIPDQWDSLDSVKWLTTNHIFDLQEDTSCTTILGGTVVISRFSWRKKVPFFTDNAIRTADKIPYLYSRSSNIGDTKYFCNYETAEDMEFSFAGIFFPDIKSEYNFDCLTGKNKFYVRPPSKFYLFTHGIVDFLVESEINCNFRYGKKEPKDQFYSGQNLSEYLQEDNLSISEPNTFYYNNSYSFPVSNTPYKKLDRTYSKDVWKKRALRNNAWIWSEKDVNEDSLTDPWLVFKPLNFWEDKSNRGELIDLRSIESNQFLGRYEDQMQLFNQVSNVADAINNQNKELGTGFLYNRPISFKKADLGFAGTQNTDFVSTPYGHFWADAKRGRIFQVDQNGGNMEIISEMIGNQPSGKKQWFREHLPFKILKQFPQANINNKFKGLGMNLWYDDRNSRVFFTKRDYISKGNPCLKYDSEIGFYEDCTGVTCPVGYTYNTITDLCEKTIVSEPLCPTGYTYNLEAQTCTLTETSPADCVEGVNEILAVADSPGVYVSVISGGQAVANVLSNDTLGGLPATLSNVVLSLVSSPHAKITLNTLTGSVDIAPGLNIGEMTSAFLTYKIQEIGNLTNFSTTSVLLNHWSFT